MNAEQAEYEAQKQTNALLATVLDFVAQQCREDTQQSVQSLIGLVNTCGAQRVQTMLVGKTPTKQEETESGSQGTISSKKMAIKEEAAMNCSNRQNYITNWKDN